MKLSAIIFSRDRACQLELLLRSIKMFFIEWEDVDFHIIYTYTDEKFKKGYDLLKKVHPEFNYILEKKSGFMEQVVDCVKKSEEYIVFFVDDNVFKEEFSLCDKQVKIFEKNTNILCCSLRLAPQITYSYVRNINVSPPKFKKDLIWDWQEVKHVSLWGYPMSVDGHIFRKREFLEVLEKTEFTNPNTLEKELSRNPIDKKYMICFQKPIIVNIPWNKVQDENENRSEEISPSVINEGFLKGKRISIKEIIERKNKSTHESMEISF